ncbi:K(+) efflux antiporter 2, chloroplastic-like, partial [Camellia sinensis]|uniref:K(+) efflux antiporter 2, chloroplastic-like n=1 Tax=Camellia sinensis TaxID=4442 RepID=UPI001035BD60
NNFSFNPQTKKPYFPTNSTMFEEKAQRISEAAIALKDEAANAWDNVNSTRNTIQEIVNEETVAQEAVQEATMALSLAEARLQVVVDSLEAAKGRKSDLEYESGGEESNILRKDEEAVLISISDTKVYFLIYDRIAFYTNRVERINQLFLQPDIITAGVNEVSSNTKPLIRQIRKLPKRVKKLMEMIPYQEVNEEEASLFDMSWLLFASVIYVPIFQKIPGGSPVLGYLTVVILIEPYGLSIIHHVHETKAIAEFEVVFLMFNIGLELSVERLSSMKKYVFGLGSAQVLVTAVVVGLVSRFIAGQPSPAAIIIGDGLALSSTVVVLQVTVNEQLCIAGMR